MTKYILLIIITFVCITCGSSRYHEYMLPELPQEINRNYLKDALRYISLATQTEKIIKQTFADSDVIDEKLITFKNEFIRVLIINDKSTNIQTINIIALDNAEDLYHAFPKKMVSSQLFTFKINRYYLQKYSEIREGILDSIGKGVVRINTLGTASVYGTLLAIEIASQEIPIDTILMFGPTRFTTADAHRGIADTFGKQMISVTHESDISHLVQMKGQYAEVVPYEYMICHEAGCSKHPFALKHFTPHEVLKHISSDAHSYAMLYHDSLLQ